MKKDFTSNPIIGGWKLSQTEDNLKAADLILPSKLRQGLDYIIAIEMGFPHDFLAKENIQK